jgi:23S rRNA (uridine2552-2'-O)-methyltransferase
MVLAEQVFSFAEKFLKTDGTMIIKVFQGGTETYLLNDLKKAFKKIYHFKPKSSRKESVEMYLIASGFKKIL